jgi:AcrR family transcriptional regulator
MTSDTLPRRASPEIRREQILDAAQTCFSRSGYYRSTMDEVVRESGLSKGSLYWHFSSKEEVLLGIFDRYVELVFAAWEDERAAAPNASPRTLLVEGTEVFIESMMAERELAQTWLGFLENPAARERMALLYERSRGALAELLSAGVERGEFIPHDAAAIAAGLTGVGEGLVLQGIVDPGFNPATSLRTSVEALLKGISR